MKNFWISWYHEQSFGAFELHSPWWVSGSTETANTVCAAVRAEDEEHAKRVVVESFDTPPAGVEWRFVEEMPAGWSPFTDRFPRARCEAASTEKRPANCQCTWEEGDSPCPVHRRCAACGVELDANKSQRLSNEYCETCAPKYGESAVPTVSR